VLLLALATVIEFVAPIERHTLKSRLMPLLYWIVSTVIAAGCVLAMSSARDALGIRPFVVIPASGFGLIGDGAALCVSLIFADFLAYWQHRFQHRFIWNIHAVHHSPTALNAVNGYAHFGEKIFQYLLVGLPLSLVHFSFPATPLMIVAITELLQHYIHSPIDVRLGPLGKVLVDNRFHRIHHSLEPQHFDKNFGILFRFWDRLFGTAYEPRDEWPAVGVQDRPPPANLWQFLAYPLRYRERPNFAAGRRGIGASVQQQGR
jgi:sterol desaturase/sphingolipid hydroxylase (fatty acid hydroxylase superfamily)